MSVDKLVTDILGEQPTVKDPALRDMINARMKAGGEVKMGKGGAIKSLVKAIGKELPEAKASQKTQIPGTEPTYRKAYDILEREKPGGRTLDYGAGLGHGSRLMGAESFEPFPREGFKPDFIRPEDIPTEEFDRLVNLNVLNVMPREMRDATVENIGRVMRPGGMGIVTTRGRDVLNAAGEAGPEPMSRITSIGTYQKGFTPEELREYLKYMLGEGYDISRLNLGPAGAVVRKKGKAAGGEVKMGKGGALKKAAKKIEEYVDPATKTIEDWVWKNMPEVAQKIGLKEVPDYIQKGFGEFMGEQAKRAGKGEMGPRDLIKAYTITRSSVNRGSLPHSTATKTGMKLPATDEPVRPEGAFAEWLGSPEGQRYLDAAQRGEVDPKVLQSLQEKFSPFGMPGVLAEDMRWAAENLSDPSRDIGAMILAGPERYRELSQSVPGIGPAKSGFMGSMLGRGDFPTLDARQLRLHTEGGGKEASKFMKRKKGEGGEEAVARLAARQEALGMELDPSLDPFYQHLVHHAVWDRVGGNQTTHEDLVRAMRGYKEGGEVRKADGGAIGKNVGRGMAGLRRSRQELDPREIQAMMLDVPAGLGVPFAEAGAEYLRGNIEDAKTSAAIDAALTAVPAVGALAKPAYRAVKGAVQKAAPAVREAASGALESAMESGLIQGPSYAVKPTGGQWLGGYRGDTRQIDVRNAPAGTSEDVVQAYRDRLEDAERRAREYTEMSGFEPTQAITDQVRGLRSNVDRIEQENAVRRWVDSNLNNYIRKQMGTPEDPIRKLADEGVLHLPYQEVGLMGQTVEQRKRAGFPEEGFATTDLGRMWENLTDASIKQIEAGKLRDPEYMTDIRLRMEAQNRDFGRPGSVTNQPDYLSPEDARNARNFPMAGNAIGRETMLSNNPWLEKVDPSTPIYKLTGGPRQDGPSSVERALGLDHIIDVLKADLAAGRIRPEQLSKMSMEQAVRRTHEYDLERAAAMAKALEEETANLSVAKTFDDGFKIVQLDKPGQFAKESDRMGHSVRGYEPSRRSEDWTEASGVEGSSTYGHGGWDAIKSGKAQVFSIRDAKNQPHVTIELGRQYVSPSQWFNSLTDEEKASAIESGRRVAIEGGFMPSGGSSQKAIDEYVASYSPQFAEFQNNAPLIITQIKGKQNRKPDDDYLPYVQQFIREGNYEIAGDLRNSGLIDLQSGQRPAFVPTDAPRYVTQAELDRMQRTGKFEPDFKEGGAVQKYGKGGVVKSLIKKASEALEKPAKRMSKAEAIERGLYHEIGGGLKLQKPVTEVQVKVEPDPKVTMSPRKVLSPESMQGGVAFPLVGDRAATGKVLKELEGAPMDVRLEGGPEFMIANPGSGWASGKGVLTGLSKRVQEGAESGRDVYGVYTAMGPQAVDFNTMVTEALLNQLDVGALRKADIKAFDQAVRSIKGQGGKPKAPDFPGVAHPELKSILMEGPGGQRDAFVKAMAKAQFQNKGFPDVVAARVGVTDPALIDVSRGSTGFTVAKMDPAGTVFEQSGHTTYPFDLAGEYAGGFEQQIPHDIMFYDPVQAKRLLGSTPIGAQKSLEINAPLQYLDQEWLDRVMNYLETQRKLREGFKKGGKVKTKRSALSSLEKAK